MPTMRKRNLMDTIASAMQQQSYLTCVGSDQIGDLDALGQYEFDVLAQLGHHRRPLPIYRDGIWYCHVCDFYSVDLTEVSRHLLTVHEALPSREEESYIH